MNWTIALRKFLEGAAAGAIAAAAAIPLTQDAPNWLAVAGVSIAVGALRGGLNAFKHKGK